MQVAAKMNPLRLIGYFGIVLLLLMAGLGIFLSIENHDWYGTLIMICFLGVIALFAFILWSNARAEKENGLIHQAELGWLGVSFSTFVRGPILHTPEGLIFLAGSIIAIIFAILSYSMPTWVGLTSERSAINTTAFGLWPIVDFVSYIKFCAPDFRPRIFSSLLMATVVLMPFYSAYRWHLPFGL